MTGFDFVVNNKPYHGYRAMPDFMITLSMALKTAPCLSQILFKILGIIGH